MKIIMNLKGIDKLKKNNSFAISLSDPSFSPKSLKNITLSNLIFSL